jgi:hypothetical protein
MPNPSISNQEAEKRIAAVEEKLKRGHPGPGVASRRGVFGAIRTAAAGSGVSSGGSTSWYNCAVEVLGREADWSVYVPPEPVGRAAFNAGAEDGYNVKGRSTYYSPDGSIKGEWVKTTRDQERQEEMLREAIQAMTDRLPRIKPTAGPKSARADLMACYPVSDHHLGMLSWHEETGGNWDLEIAETTLSNAMAHLVESVPSCERATIILLGDLLHYDSFEAVTPKNRNLLDADGRYPQMVRAAIRVVRRMVQAALKRHGSVHLIVEPGNHDPSSSIFLMESLSNIYENEDRLTVDTSPSKFHYFSFGKCLVGIHHGDGAKPADLPLIMAVDRAQEWGEAEFRYIWTGHIHTDNVKDFRGVRWESFRILAPPDAWAAGKGYRSRQDMKAIVLHKEFGEVARYIVNPTMLVSDGDG